MSAIAPVSLPPSLVAPVPAVTPVTGKRADIKRVAQEFEASFLAIMINQMFQEVDISAPFGGGPGEEMFKSFLGEAVAKQMVKAGGVGLADTVAREMLRMQGLEE